MDTQATVLQVFAELTRYPTDILDPEADLEADLGIDSVKRTEILAALQERFALPADLQAPAEQVTTIAAIAAFIEQAAAGAAPVASGAAPVMSGAAHAPALPEPPRASLVSPSFAAPSFAAPSFAAPPIPAPAASAPRGAARYAAAPPYAPPIRAPQPASPRPATPAASVAAVAAPTTAELRRDVLSTLRDVIDETLARLDATARTTTPQAATAQAATTQAAAQAAASRPSASSAPAGVNGLPVDGLAWAARAVRPVAAPPPAAPSHAAPRVPRPAPHRDWLPAGYRPFEGRVALVTGSGHGLGRVIATRLSRLGASVVINSFHSRDRGERTAAELQAEGGDVMHAWGSVAKRDHLERIFESIGARHGRLDFFVSNASNGMIAPLTHITEDHWQKAFTTNVIALHQASLLAAPLMDRSGGGKILAISSPGAQRYIEHFGCQGPVKAALESLVRYLAVELGPRNIQVNALSAGPLYGELLDKYPEGERLIPYWESRTATGRLGSEEQVTEAVAFLLSRASDPISGAVLLADSTGSQRV